MIPKPLLRSGLLLLLLLWPTIGLEAQYQAISIRSPYKTPAKNIELMNTIVLKTLLFLNYTEHDGAGDIWKTRDIAGLRSNRFLIQQLAGGAYRTLEIALTPFPEGGYDFYLYGRAGIAGDAFQPNPDLTTVQSTLQQIITEIQTKQQSPTLQDLGHQIVHLSYIHTDRVLAVLKSLGYTTIEFTQAAGETLYDKIFTPYQNGEWRPPVIVKLIDSAKTSLMESSPTGAYQQGTSTYSAVPDIGGTFLHHATSGEPQQRLLIIYNKNQPEALQALLSLIQNKIDRPARQIVIEALVIEVDSDKMENMGINFRAADGDYDASFEKIQTGQNLPFTFTFNRKAFSDILFFRAGLEALVKSGNAEILSNPSVLVLSGRQARIQVGQQVPVVKSTSTNAGIISSVDYFPVGIVLNLRPRVSSDGSEVTMQVETIVSAVSQSIGSQSQVFVAPTVDNRQVQTFVRVADNTPFIIGGLISSNRRETETGIPILSNIPLLGLLFKRKSFDNDKKEVIVVLTPHVLPVDQKNFSYVIPKDSDSFDSFDHTLFRNAYRIRDDDVFDLKFLYESEFFQNLLSSLDELAAQRPGIRSQAPFEGLLNGGVPGEEILVRRMIWELAFKTRFFEHIDDEKIIVFENRPDAPDSSGFKTTLLKPLLDAREIKKQNTLTLTFDARFRGTPQHPFAQPKATITYENHTGETYIARLMAGNQRQTDGSPDKWTIPLSKTNPPGVRDATSLQVLKGVLVLKRIIALNKTLPLTIKEFRGGRQIIFPTQQELKQRFHIIDRDVARFYYEVVQYYPEFEKTFNRETRKYFKAIVDAAGQ